MKRYSSLFGLMLMVACEALAAAGTLQPSVETHSGPWYRPGAEATRSLWRPGMPGQRLQLRGRVLNTRGAPVPGALVELWHTDSFGNYPPLRASLEAGRRGEFGITTVLPGHNQGYRARHIHFVVSHPAHRRLVTRIFFHGDINLDEAPYPELAVFLEESAIDGETRYHTEVEFVLVPNP